MGKQGCCSSYCNPGAQSIVCCCLGLDAGIKFIAVMDFLLFAAHYTMIAFLYRYDRPERDIWLFSFPCGVTIPCIGAFFLVLVFKKTQRVRKFYWLTRLICFFVLLVTQIIACIYLPLYITSNYTEVYCYDLKGALESDHPEELTALEYSEVPESIDIHNGTTAEICALINVAPVVAQTLFLIFLYIYFLQVAKAYKNLPPHMFP